MPQQDIAHTKLCQHIGGHFTRKGTTGMHICILGTQLHRRAIQQLLTHVQIGVRRTDCNVDIQLIHARDQLGQQLVHHSLGAMHFPVTCNQGTSHRLSSIQSGAHGNQTAKIIQVPDS